MKIREIGRTVTGKTPSTQKEENFGGDILFITPSDIRNGGYIDNTERNISEQGFQSIRANTISGKSILVGCIGSDMGNVAWTDKKCASNQQINAITDIKEDYNPLFIYYNLLMKKDFLRQIAGTTTTPILPKSVFDEIEILIPEKKQQDRIVDVLQTLDAKIQNNNKIIAELESMAKTIYDYWFLQFDFPNENGKPYKSSGGKMVWNKKLKREIPEGWESNQLGEVCKTLLGGTPSTQIKEYWNGDISWLNSGEIAYSPILASEKKITELGMNNSATSFAEAGTIVMSITRYIRPAILGIDACFNQSVVAIVPNKIYRTSFIYPFMISQVDRYMKLRTGAQQPHINKEIVDTTYVISPKSEVLDEYYKKVEQLYTLQLQKAKENQELTLLRDFLLPLLMNKQVGFK